MKITSGLCLVALALIAPLASGQERGAPRFKVLLPVSDDQQSDALRAWGNAQVRTPNLGAWIRSADHPSWHLLGGCASRYRVKLSYGARAGGNGYQICAGPYPARGRS